ncbi:SpoIIE family protein phosphatase [Streptomyces bambusae]|uniref:SpoIIE family protein phosphatase n=1 Tax=Streptomyces bambusae TaxID=1550616 RepID=UPI001CFD4E80|nr:SpoIIE family protein phosphatase [Streptomyces bambusae]MCB5166761.1 SpoIIE family protein phosphatase [Streptomyces bambusae]
MRPRAGGAHPGSVTGYGVAGHPAPPGPPAPDGDAHGTAAAPGGPDALTLALARATVSTTEAVGGYAGGVYLRSRTDGLLRLSVLAGLPGRLFGPWWRMHVNRPFPVAQAHRTGQAVHLADAEEAMRRFPQLMAGLPFPFGSLYEPVAGGGERYGVLMVLRPAQAGAPVGAADRRAMRDGAARLAAALAALEAAGTPAEWEAEPVCVQLPEPAAPPVRSGHFTWDLDTGAMAADAGLCELAGVDPAAFRGTAAELMARWAPEDRFGIRAAALALGGPEGPSTRRMPLRGTDGRILLLEMTALPDRRLTGFVLDPGAGAVPDEAADRLPQAVVSVDRLGRVTYANPGTRAVLGVGRAELTGRVLWEALPWLGHPAYADYFRSVLLSGDHVSFPARRSPREWLTVFLHPDRNAVTVTFAATEHPAYTPGSVVRPGAGTGSPADRAAALYRPVALAIALTEAVTARQVSAVVTDELLPAFGGRQLAIYLLNERHLYLAWETGFPHGFLDRFDGVSLDERLPGVETLTSGRPIFFESMEHLAAAYPGIPLDSDVGARAFLPLIASGRPVGSCILGFEAPRGFSPEDRTVLTALAGLIAQALERAQRYDTEAALARGLQDALLPHRLPRHEGLDTVGRYLAGTQGMDVGGDWYDVIEAGDGLLALVIGDVQGHGVAAAATMGQLRSAVRAFALGGNSPQDVVRGTNRLLIDLDPGQFASCCYVLLDPVTGVARAARAGHPQPLLRRADGVTEVLDLPGGVVLGVDGSASYPVAELALEPGAVLALYTDGLVEQPGTDIDLGVERLRGALAGAGRVPLGDLADRLIGEALRTADRPDDIALLLAARRAPGPQEG